MENKDEHINNKKTNPQHFGVPEASYDPIKTIKMEGNFYRKLTSKRPRSLLVRIVSIVFGILLIIPGAFIILIPVLFSFAKLDSVSDWAGYLFAVVISLLFIVVGLKIFVANLKS